MGKSFQFFVFLENVNPSVYILEKVVYEWFYFTKICKIINQSFWAVRLDDFEDSLTLQRDLTVTIIFIKIWNQSENVRRSYKICIMW